MIAIGFGQSGVPVSIGAATAAGAGVAASAGAAAETAIMLDRDPAELQHASETMKPDQASDAIALVISVTAQPTNRLRSLYTGFRDLDPTSFRIPEQRCSLELS
jgi:hypothetical protein